MRDRVVDIPALVRGLRKKLNLTQEQFAHRVGVTYSTINNWENGKRKPQPFLIGRLGQISQEINAEANARPKMRSAKQK